MPVTFRPGSALLLNPLHIFIPRLHNNGVAMEKPLLDRNEEDCFAFLFDLVRNRFWNQEERYTLDALRRDYRAPRFTGHRLPPRESPLAALRSSGSNRS